MDANSDGVLPEDHVAMFRQALQEHGHAFQYAVIAAIEQASKRGGYGWNFMAAEAPLTLHSHEAHADCLFQAQARYLIGECKCVNPAYRQWLFARSRYSAGGGPAPILVEELFIEHGSQYRPQIRPFQFRSSQEAYQVGVTVRTKDKGQGCVSDKNAIEDAMKQAYRAASGFIELCAGNLGIAGVGVNHARQFVPAIFTTAELYTCETELEASDLATGKLPADTTFRRRPWVWFQRGLSESMRAVVEGRYPPADHSPSWSRYFQQGTVRSVAIVNVEGIWSFLDEVDKL